MWQLFLPDPSGLSPAGVCRICARSDSVTSGPFDENRMGLDWSVKRVPPAAGRALQGSGGHARRPVAGGPNGSGIHPLIPMAGSLRISSRLPAMYNI